MQTTLFIKDTAPDCRDVKLSSKALSIVGSSRNNGARETEDFYPTPSYAVERLIEKEIFTGSISECAGGQGDRSLRSLLFQVRKIEPITPKSAARETTENSPPHNTTVYGCFLRGFCLRKQVIKTFPCALLEIRLKYTN